MGLKITIDQILRYLYAHGFMIFFITFFGLNTSFARCESNYIPPTTFEELQAIQQWAIVLAFIPMAKQAGYSFDHLKYMEENPNPNIAAFNFGFVTGTKCYSVDVVRSYYSYSVVLNQIHIKDKEAFKAYYLKEAERYGYTNYLVELKPSSEINSEDESLMISSMEISEGS